MDNVDRLLRIFYKDCNLRRLFEIYENGGELAQCFTLDNDICQKRIISDYQWIYPHNYNEDVLEHIIEYYREKVSCRIGEEAGSKDAILLLRYCVDKMLEIKNNQIKVKFKHISEWDGLLNKIDSNILIGLKCALLSNREDLIECEDLLLDQKQTTLNYSFAEDEAPKFKDLAENHMHLKGSGYSTDMSMQALLHTTLSSVETLDKEVLKLKYDDRVFGVTEEEAVDNLRKIKLIRLFLVDLQRQTPLFSQPERRAIIKERYRYLQKDTGDRLEKLQTKIEQDHMDMVRKMKLKGCHEVKRYFVLSRYFFGIAFLNVFHDKKEDAEYRYLLNMYIAGISKLRFLFAQDNTGMGFTRFKRYEDRKTECLGNIRIKNYDIYKSVFDKYIEEKNIKKVEFRIAPPSNGKSYRRLCRELESIEEWYNKKEAKTFQYGMIIHFIKPKDDKMLATTSEYHRYEQYLNGQEKCFQTLLSLIEQNDSLTEKIVGIDAANYELNCPPEVFAGMFKQLKKYMEDNTKRKLFQTFHVGEDFRTIVTGLRRIDEAIEFLEMKEGDRLGHASAAGLDLEYYYRSTRNYCSTTRQEWLDDLAWMYHIISADKVLECEEKRSFCLYLREHFKEEKPCRWMDNAGLEFKDVTILEYYESFVRRGEWICEESERRELEKDIWLKAFFHSPKLYEEGQEKLLKKIDKTYLECVRIAQKNVVEKIIEKKIIIEANPSSNRKISHVQNNEDLPIIQIINKFAIQNAWSNICINTDDSAIFQTNLNNEYMIVYNYYKQINNIQMIMEMALKSEEWSFVGKKQNNSIPSHDSL